MKRSRGLDTQASRDINDEVGDPDDAGSDGDVQLEKLASTQRDKKILARATKRSRLYRDLEVGDHSSLLETLAVKPGTSGADSYKYFHEAFKATLNGRPIQDLPDYAVDQRMVHRLNTLFLGGMDLSAGEKTLAALHHFHPEFTKFGTRRVPRSWKCILAWRRRAPGRSRNPKAWMVIAALICRLVARGQCRAAVYVAVLWSTWCRPSELLRLRRRDIVRPQPGITLSWSVVIAPSRLDLTTKTGETDVSIELDAPETKWLAKPLELLASGDPDELVWDFDYPALAREVRLIGVKELGVPDLVVYSVRHSAATWSVLKHKWAIPRALKKGRWACLTSLNKYVKAARVAQEVQRYTTAQVEFFRACDRQVRDVVLCQALPLRLPWSVPPVMTGGDATGATERDPSFSTSSVAAAEWARP